MNGSILFQNPVDPELCHGDFPVYIGGEQDIINSFVLPRRPYDENLTQF